MSKTKKEKSTKMFKSNNKSKETEFQIKYCNIKTVEMVYLKYPK